MLNHVTNHGLLDLAIHRAGSADLHTVQLAEGVAAVERHCGSPRDRIFTLGALTAADDLQKVREFPSNEQFLSSLQLK